MLDQQLRLQSALPCSGNASAEWFLGCFGSLPVSKTTKGLNSPTADEWFQHSTGDQDPGHDPCHRLAASRP